MLNGTNLLIAGIAAIAGGIMLIIFGPGETGAAFGGMLIGGGLTLWGAKPMAQAINKNQRGTGS